MARFHCLIRPFAALVDRHAAVSLNTLRTLRALRLDDADDGAEEPGPQGHGWFDSSWELVRGLDVREGLPGDAGLYEWLDVCLRPDAGECAAVTMATAASPQRALRATSPPTSRATASPRSITAIA